MKTSGTNRKLKSIFDGITSKKFILRPPFQRNLVWATKHRNAIVQTVLDGYPFPEIYIATGELNLDTASGTEILVDGLQRISSLYHYFIDSPEFEYEKEMKKYKELSPKQKTAFLEYEVVIRDLGSISDSDIIEVFRRINSTSYNLRKIEVNNAYYDGEFINYCDELSENVFFNKYNIFSSTDIKRMNDVSFCATLVATLLGGYFDSDAKQEIFFQKYNDEFPEKEEIKSKLETVFNFIDDMSLGTKRLRQKSDLFTLIIELHNTLFENNLDVHHVAKNLEAFYSAVDNNDVNFFKRATEYNISALQATNKRSSRIKRAEIIREIILS